MLTSLKLELSDEQRAALGVALTGKKHAATRAEIQKWAYQQLGRLIDQSDPTKIGPVRLQSTVCPKCARPISVKVAAPPAVSSGQASPKYAKAAEAARMATQALEKALCELRGAM